MTQTFTQTRNITAKPQQSSKAGDYLSFAEPSPNIIQNILAFSKNLEVKSSVFIKHVEIMKS